MNPTVLSFVAGHSQRAMVRGAFVLLSAVALGEQRDAEAWKWGPILNQPQTALGCAASDSGSLFVVGGTYWGVDHSNEPTKHWLKSVWRLDPSSGQWQRLPDFPHPVGYPLVVSVGNRIYAIGGRNAEGVLNSTYSLRVDTPDAAWSRGPDLPGPFCRLRGGLHEGTIYAFADGYANASDPAKVEKPLVLSCRIAAPNAHWTVYADGPGVDLGYAAATVAGGKLYLFGGATRHESGKLTLLDTTWAFDLQTRRWSTCQPLPLCIRDPTATAIGEGLIAIVGGVLEVSPSDRGKDEASARLILSSKCLIYDTRDDSYRYSTPLHQAVADHGQAVLGSRLWVVGGEDSVHRTRTDLVQHISLEAFLLPAAKSESANLFPKSSADRRGQVVPRWHVGQFRKSYKTDRR